MDRRELLGLAALGALDLSWPASPGAAAQQTDRTADAPRLWYRQPARMWLEALPVGNGMLGAMVSGGVRDELLQLNHHGWWAGQPYHPVNPAAREALPRVRQLILDGRIKEAHTLADAALVGRPASQMPYQTAGALLVRLTGVNDNDAESYERDLDLDGALASASFTAGGRRYRREVFASHVDRVLVVRLSCDAPGAIDAQLAWRAGPDAAALPAGDDQLLSVLRGASSAGVPGGLTLALRAQALPRGGRVVREGDALTVRGADELVVLVALDSSHRRFDRVDGDPVAATRDLLAAAAAKSYATLLANHQADHRQLFRAAALEIGRSPVAELSTDARVAISRPQDDPALASLYFAYARYLLIACSRIGGQPANLQGMWNDSNAPAWGSKYTININTQMNYWLAEPANLAPCVAPLVAMVEELAASGARTAREMYGARGWVAHHNTDLWRATAPVDGSFWGLWPMGGAWLCLHLWDHYDYGRSAAFLRRVWPVMRGAALFFLDTLAPEPGSDRLLTNPSLSPENDHGHGGSLCAGPAMDMQILRDLFARCVEAGAILRLDADLCARFAAARARLIPDRVGRAGQLMEWRDDWDGDAPDQRHRHVSHLYGLYPSDQINRDDTPALAAAARRSLERRGDASTGWGLAWRASLWARLGDGERALGVLHRLLSSPRTYPNLFDAHPPFQIDGNFGGAAAMIELLVHSRGDLLELLPALPAAWPHGSIRGVRVRGAAELDLRWTNGQLSECLIRPRIGGTRVVRCGSDRRTVELRPGRIVRLLGPGLQAADA
ncbi:alpha-L-fucosidase 2 [Sphingomonas guangdongensis]|uniref:Alpha-L-fucosidase 2 n=1 Tax=Sphingomonas guangdongensis TaxID=1141890 RepID=A0A285QCE8_9SPHN|nr:glycoside hydrolase family 95 protein [Sphingomonas guangdongensis]SOB79506.1 alpha-L-fucosidase 2 [Sphingomonas guangdongensis]